MRQDFAPLFDAAVTIADPDLPLGTHVFTALEFIGDDHTTLRWNVVSLPGEPPRRRRATRRDEKRYGRYATADAAANRAKTVRRSAAAADARRGARPHRHPQEAIDDISQLIVPGSSLIVSDQGLGEETGDGTDFIVVVRMMMPQVG